MSILLTGGTGFIGYHLRVALRESPVVLLGRSKPKLHSREQWFYTDLTGVVESTLLASADTLCHLAYSTASGRRNVDHNLRLLDAVNASPSIRQVVLMSSTSVYGGGGPSVIDEDSPCNPIGEYAYTKLACEKVWRDGLRRDCNLVVLRPSEVIGPGGRGLRVVIQDAFDRPLIGTLKRSLLYHRPLHYVAVSSVVAAVLFCLQQARNATREIYIVSDDHHPENKSYAAMQDQVRAILGRRPLPSIPIPRQCLRSMGKLTGRALDPTRTISSQKLHSAGFRDAVTLRDEVERLLRSLEIAV